MAPRLGGDDPDHDLPDAEKDERERNLRAEALRLSMAGDHRLGRRRLERATEISRRKSRRAHRGRD